MISFLRWFGRALFALLILLLLAGAFVIVRFEDWKKARLAELDAGSRIVETRAGPFELTERGQGPAVLICHGAPGGYDQALLIGETLATQGFRVIAPSRPGFLRTPFTTGLLFEDQADALAALLDALDIQTAAVVGFSTGTQVAVQFALRHPDRTNALVLLSPVTAPYRRDPATEWRQLLPDAALFKTTGDMGTWLFTEQARRDPRWMLDAVLKSDTDLDALRRDELTAFVLGDPAQLAFFRQFLATQAPLSPRESGTRNDLLLVRLLTPIPYDQIRAPTLLVSGTADQGRPWTDLQPITTLLPTARTLTVADAGHLVWFGPHADAAQRAVREFLAEASASPSAPAPD